MTVIRELWVAEPILTSVAVVVVFILMLMARDVVNTLRPKQTASPYSWE